jgi:chromosome segregation ATPase
MKPTETTADAYRFEVNLGGNATEAFAVREERVYDQTMSVSSLTPDIIATFTQNKALSDAARRQLEQIAQKKREIAANDGQLRQAQADLNNLTQDEERQRRNIESLRNVAGQQNLVQQYAGQLAAAEVKLAGLRDQESQLQKKKTALEAELNGLIEKAEF